MVMIINFKVGNKTNCILTIMISLILTLTLSSSFAQNEIKYNIEDGLYTEIPIDSIAENRFTIDNEIYQGGNIYYLTYAYINPNSERIYFAVDKENKKMMIYGSDTIYKDDWKFVAEECIDKNTITYLKLKILPDFGLFKDVAQWYTQSVIEYEYYNNDNKLIHSESTGLIENQKNIWMHPPRIDLFRILEINPFPYVKLPCNVGDKWDWSLSVGDAWGDDRWKKWEGKIINKYSYSTIGKQIISTGFYENIECYVVESNAESKIGLTSLNAFFNEQLGFIKLEYINIDNSKLIIELKKM